ncbi:MAG: peptidylprolyl isomerase [Bacteroidales bacterium]|nr:peptidylprolyl isomerase [Bacteroidales bacterium]
MKALKIFFSFLILTTFVSTIYAQDMNNQKDTKVLIKTTMGDMTAILYAGTPYHTENFIKLVNEHYYDGLLFHRVINEFMIQGGDPNSKDAPAGKALGNGGPDYTIPAEITPKYFHKKGALSAARTGDQMNPTRRSSGSQFYVVTGKVYTNEELDMFEKKMFTKFTDEQREAYTTIGGTPFLDAQYTVFGEVIEGIEVAVEISKVAKDSNDRPKEDVKIISITIIE